MSVESVLTSIQSSAVAEWMRDTNPAMQIGESMLVLAAVNRLKLVPRVAASNYTPAAMLLWWSILAELALSLVILLVVGALGVTPLGADE